MDVLEEVEENRTIQLRYGCRSRHPLGMRDDTAGAQAPRKAKA
jgi:hypothetical protein